MNQDSKDLNPRSLTNTPQILNSKGQTKLKGFFQADVSSKKGTNEFYFTTMKPQVDLFSFVFWKKLNHQKDISKLTDL